jgi:uncharacterized protein (DUF488 family)
MNVRPDDTSASALTIYTVGHSNQPRERFIALLQRHSVQTLVDVRSAPYSRYVPHFNRLDLEEAVERVGMRYLYLGEELGGRPPTEEYYDAESHVLYGRVAVASFFLRGLERLKAEAALHRAAIMCSEEDPTNCHRHLLIARVLDSQGVTTLHIRGDDREQTETDLRPPALAIMQADLWSTSTEPNSDSVDEDATWKSIRPVSRKNQPKSSSSPYDEGE